jgi:hypothetical protein
MIRNILTRIFSGESSPASENKPATQTTAPPTQSFGISSVGDSFESTASKGSPQFDLGLIPPKQDYENAAQKQGHLLEQKKKIDEEQKKLEELREELQESKDKSPFDAFGTFLTGDDKGTMDYQTQDALNTYNQAEKSSQHISQTVDDTTDDVKKHFG